MPARKRFNAFEDFSNTNSEKTKLVVPPGEETRESEATVERIERLKPSEMMPDRFQPRRLLPPALREAFFSGKSNCYQTAMDWLTLSRSDPGIHREVEQLLAMGASFDEHGQIKSITGSWQSTPKGDYFFLIETGERRFWAACLQYASSGVKDEPLLRVEVVAHPTRQRQVLENRHAEPPSAVEQACEVASLILAELGITPDVEIEDDFDFFRLARNQRMPVGLWDRLTPIMQLTRPRMVQLLNILQLPSPLLDLSDRYRLSERVLREVLSAPRDQWERMIRLSIQNQLTSEEVAEEAITLRPAEPREPSPSAPVLPDPNRQAVRSARKFIQHLGELDHFAQQEALDEIADSLAERGQAIAAADIFEELARLLRVRSGR
jgi:hypothetical protein